MLSGYEISGFALGLATMFEISNEVLYVRYDESSRRMGILYRLGWDERMRKMRKEEQSDESMCSEKGEMVRCQSESNLVT